MGTTATTRTSARSLGVAVVAAVALAACGGGDGATAGAGGPASEAVTPTAPATTDPATTDPTATDPTADPATTEPTAAEEATTEPAASAPAGGGADEAPSPAVPVGTDDGSAASAQGLDAAPTGSTDPVRADPSGGQVLFKAVRVASQDGFDRVVFEYEGDGLPGYQFAYQDEARQQATGDLVDLPGATGLRGTIRSIDWTSDENYVFPKRVQGEGTRSVTVVDVGVLFEGDQDPYIGVTEEKPFRVTVLEDPTRIVVDVAH